jgi:general stress protein 26
MENLAKFKDLVEDIKTAMFVTQQEDGKLTSRPMGTVKVDEDGSLWFFTNEFSKKVEEISRDNKIMLNYASPSSNSYVSVTARAWLVDDHDKMKELWSPVMKAWFPDGLDDPKLLLIRAEPDEAEYWNSSSSKIIVGFKMLGAILKGETYNGEGEHGKIKI